MKTILLIFGIAYSSVAFAQGTEVSSLEMKEYNDILNYIPKNLESDTAYFQVDSIPQINLNSLGMLYISSSFPEFYITEQNKTQFENRAEEIAEALFLDGKRILIWRTGGYAGCPDQMMDSIRLNDIDIIAVKFCYTCTGYGGSNFIAKFNNKMYKLMGIKAPDAHTDNFYGQYKGIGRHNSTTKLILNEDRTFKFWMSEDNHAHFTQGFWENRGEILILDSKNLSGSDSLNYAISNTHWIELNDVKWSLKKNQLIREGGKRLKLKQVID